MTSEESLEEIKPLKLRKDPLYQQSYEALTEMIFTGQLKQGVRVTETSLSKMLGISPTPVREALRKLEQDGLVKSVDNEFRITSVSADDIKELYVCRMALERVGIEAAVDRLTRSQLEDLRAILEDSRVAAEDQDVPALVRHNTRFHDRILEASGNKWLKAAVAFLRKPLLLARAQVTLKKGELPRILNDHQKVLEALERRDKQAAAQALVDHMTTDSELMRRTILDSSETGSTA